MHQLRLFDQKAIALQRTGKLATYPAATGQEAVCIGVGHAMEKTDVLCPYYRDQGTLLQRGVSMGELLAYWGGDERGNQFKNNPHDLPIAVPIASQCLHAAGVAYAFWQRKQPCAVVATLGDGGTSKGDFYEAINVAGIWKLPVVFVINNNQWAISISRQAQTAAETLAQKAVAAGIAGIQVDGNDVIAVREVVAQALASARAGKGATVIEAMTYRLCDHTTADDARRYAPTEEIKAAQAKEPIQRLRHYLTTQGHWSDQQETNLINTLKSTIDAAATSYLNTPKQPATAMFDSLYAYLPAALASQRASLATEQSPPIKQAAEKPPSVIQPCVYPMLNLVQAVNQALHDAMAEDSQVLILGQDVGKNGGVFRATLGLWEKFGAKRVLDTPLAESMIAGMAIGMATQGLKPVAEFQFMGFIYAGIDHILSHAARMRHRTRGRLSCPLV
jgi:pyruvate dehydrogenase E1 component alpha subunit